MASLVQPFTDILALNTGLLVNCLDGVDDECFLREPAPGANSMCFLAAHCLDARGYLATFCGLDVPHPLAERLGAAKGAADLKGKFTLAELIAAWRTQAEGFLAQLGGIDDAALLTAADQPFPVAEKTVRGGLNFLVAHESYHIGQMALLRRVYGLEAMKYS